MESEGDSASGDDLPAEGAGEALDAEKKRSEDLLTRLKYMQADMENYKKRVEREAREAGESSMRQLVLKLLAVSDELDLALEHAEHGQGERELMEGLGMVKKNLGSALESAGVERIDSVGKAFDPAYHEAVERTGSGSNYTVTEELRPGFIFRGRLLRPSMVRVGASQSKGDGDEGE